MKKRLIGLETEYAIRNSTPENQYKDNRIIYENIIQTFRDFVYTAESSFFLKWNQIFTENGSSFCYESLPYYIEAGLLEAATPECESPFQLLKYQRSIDYLITRSLNQINNKNKIHFIDKISLIKNCRDAKGNIYGAQENYSVSIGDSNEFFLYRFFLSLYLPLLGLYLILFFILSFFILLLNSIFIVIFYFIFLIFSFFLFRYKKNIKLLTIEELNEPPEKITFFILFKRIITKILTYAEIFFSFPVIILYVLTLKHIAFRKFKKHLLPFLISRIILTGSGGIDEEGNFYISEKVNAIKRVSRTTNFPADRSIFDSGNLMKLAYLALIHLTSLKFNYIKQLLSKTQRMQIGLSDSCMSEEAELIKIGATNLLIDMIEDDFIQDTMEIPDPIQTLKFLNFYPNIFLKIKVKKNQKIYELSLIEIQKFYLEEAKKYLKNLTVIDPESIKEYNEIIKIWEELLNKLEKNPISLFGRIDWITKKILIDQTIAREEQLNYQFYNSFGDYYNKFYKKYYKIIKIIDIKYHDLYDGYYLKLKENKLTHSFFSEKELWDALKNPPKTEKGFAHIRSTFVKKNIASFENIQVSWDYARIGHGAFSKVIDFSSYKKQKEQQ